MVEKDNNFKVFDVFLEKYYRKYIIIPQHLKLNVKFANF